MQMHSVTATSITGWPFQTETVLALRVVGTCSNYPPCTIVPNYSSWWPFHTSSLPPPAPQSVPTCCSVRKSLVFPNWCCMSTSLSCLVTVCRIVAHTLRAWSCWLNPEITTTKYVQFRIKIPKPTCHRYTAQRRQPEDYGNMSKNVVP